MLPSILLLIFFLSPAPSLSLNQDGLYLLQAKASLSDPFHSLSSWNLRDLTPCRWGHVTCDPSTHRVTALDFSDALLAGPFPTVLCRLPSLSFLSFHNNSLNSSLPSDISSCQSLESLRLDQNYLGGLIPDSLSQLPSLKSLDLSGNSFTGEIPASFGHFQQLELLSLTSNFLNGTLPPFLGNISTLKDLSLAYNPLAPSLLPSELCNLTHLENLWLSGCSLVGSIPPSLGKLTQLKNLDLSANALTGSIPNSITGLKNVVQIELYNNSLSGELPTGMSNLTLLKRFDASMNRLRGSIPEDLCELHLESLNLYSNRLEGSVPESITRSPNLQELKLWDNKLSGKLPSKLGENSPLKWLDVSSNQFVGDIPENLCAQGVLEGLLMIHNSFSGEIPASLGQCRSLIRIRLGNNRFSGTVPGEFWGLPRVSLLELVQNSLSGHISSKVYEARNLSILKISNNQFSGVIPEEIGSLSNLLEFSGGNNNISGEMPASLAKLNQLNKLDLSHNKLSGKIPAGIRAWENLNELNLANNRLSGEIPDEIGSIPVLNYLDLSGNHFYGKIPPGLQNLKLNLLNLSNNQLSGDLPPFFDKDAYRNSFLGNPRLCGDLPGLCPQRIRTKKEGYLWIFISIFILAGLVFVVGIVWFYLKYQRFRKSKTNVGISKWKSFHKLGFSELEIAKSLDDNNAIGSGASGKVYKVVLSNGEVVAVKKIWGETKKGDADNDPEKDGFEVEVETLGRIRHKNIVRLWCCCNSGDFKLLVYEYMPHGSLGDLLHSSKGSLLDWPTRYKIALDAAEGLSYLHHDCVPPIVHRDVKSNNILLDSEFGAKVADFGVAKVIGGSNKSVETMSVIAGSCGYIAPEYAYTLRVNEKSDIYSFGVVILELVTGRRPVDPEFGEIDVVKWVCSTIDRKGVERVIDPKLDSSNHEEICSVLDIGLLCTSDLPINRPSMRRVVKLLREIRVENKAKSTRKDGKLSPYYCEDVSDQGSLVREFSSELEIR